MSIDGVFNSLSIYAQRTPTAGRDVPDNYRVGRFGPLGDRGFAYRNFLPAAVMPFYTSTRLLKAGFVMLTDAEAAEIALAEVDLKITRYESQIAWQLTHPEGQYQEHYIREYERRVKVAKATKRKAQRVIDAALKGATPWGVGA